MIEPPAAEILEMLSRHLEHVARLAGEACADAFGADQIDDSFLFGDQLTEELISLHFNWVQRLDSSAPVLHRGLEWRKVPE